MNYTRFEKAIIWSAEKLPTWIMEQPERVLLNVACFLVGITTIIPPPSNHVLTDFPDLGRVVLGSLLLAGSATSLYGTMTLSRAADRLGALMLGGSSLFLAIILFGTVGLRAMLTGIIFLAIFSAKSIRFIRATAVRIRIRHHLMEEKARQESAP